MYQIVIMDSLRSNRQKIRHYLEDFDTDYRIVGDASSTEQTQRILNTKQVDLIIGDDTLTNPTALNLFNSNRESKPGLHMILFTDNPMFSNTIETLASGRLDYLKKPIRKSDVLSSLRRMSNLIDNAQAKAARSVDLRYRYDENILLFKERFLMNLIYGSIRKSDYILKQLSYFEIPHRNIFTAAIFKIDDYRRYELAMTEDEKQFMIFRLNSHIAGQLENKGIALISRYDEITLLFTAVTEKMAIIEHCNQLHDSIHRSLDIPCTVGIGQSYEDPAKIHLSYNQGVDAVLEHDYLGTDTVIHIDYVSGKNDLAYAYGPEQENTFIRYALSGQKEASLRTLKKILMAISTKNDYSSGFYAAFINKLLYHLYRDGLAHAFRLEAHLKPYVKATIITNITSAPAAFDFISLILEHVTEYVMAYKTDRDQILLNNTLKYVQAYYASRISLTSAAQYLMTTPQHLEDILYRVYEKTFYDFCMMVRIENAKDMLVNTRRSISEIGSAVGFTSTEYFVAIFRQYTNMTPTEYKHQNLDTANPPIILEKPAPFQHYPRRLR